MFLRRFTSLSCKDEDEESAPRSRARSAPSPSKPIPAPDPIAVKIGCELMSKCEFWVREAWGTPATPIAALVREKLNLDDEDAYIFGWHGTSETNVPLICHYGFDVELRKGQQYGPGEYFGWTNGTSIGYCRDGNLLLVCLILKGRWTTQQPGTAIIVRNPQSTENASYCLPLLVVNFGQRREVSFMQQSAPGNKEKH